MKKYILLFLFSVPGFLKLPAQSLFSRSIDNDSAIYVGGVMLIDNKLIINSNNTDDILSSSYGTLMLKSDLEGNVIWQQEQKKILSGDPVTLNAMVQSDTVYLAAGHVQKGGPHETTLLMYFDKSGNMLDYKIFRLSDTNDSAWRHRPTLITHTDDGHIVMCGVSDHILFDQREIMWVRTTIEGSNYKFEHLHSEKNLFPVKLIPMSNGNGEVVVAGYAGNYLPPDPPEDNFPRLFRVDSSGDYIWVKDFILPYPVTLTDIIRLSDDGYLLTGNGQHKSYLFKTNAEFEVQWMKSAEFPDTTAAGPFPGFYSVHERNDHHLLIAGSQRLNNSDAYSLLIETDAEGNLLQVKLDSNGRVFSKIAAMPFSFTLLIGRDKLNHLCFSSLDSAFNYACELTPAVLDWYDDEFPFVVIHPSFSPTIKNTIPAEALFFLRYDKNYMVYDGCIGILSIANEEGALDDDFSIFPNPGNERLIVAATLHHEESLIIQVLDLRGRKLFEEKVGKVSGAFSKQLDLGSFSSGSYLIQLIHNEQQDIKKLIIAR